MKKSKLTSRELEIMLLIINEYTSRDISTQLFISHETVLSHRKNILIKLEARNVAGMVRKAFELELVSPRVAA